MRTSMISAIAAALIGFVSTVQAQVVTMDEALMVAHNWIVLTLHNEKTWGDSETAEVESIEEFESEGQVLGYLCRVTPSGYVLISLRKEFAPVKAYSTTRDFDPECKEEPDGFIRQKMKRALDRVQERSGRKEITAQAEAQDARQAANQALWSEFSQNERSFEAASRSGVSAAWNYAIGTCLLTSNWDQEWPYNSQCPPMSCSGAFQGGRALVGCVPIAAAQIMRYWNWPPYAEGSSPSDTYDWQAMEDTVSFYEQDDRVKAAVGKLCRRIGDAVGADYGCSNTTAWLGDNPANNDMLNAYLENFFYSDDADVMYWRFHSSDYWWGTIKNNINAHRPIQYAYWDVDVWSFSSVGHSFVVDGWKEEGGMRQVHTTYRNWVTINDENEGDNDFPGYDGMISDIYPQPSLGSWLGDTETYEEYWINWIGIVPDYVNWRYVDQDTAGVNITFNPGQNLQFFPGARMTCAGGTIRFAGTPSDNTRLLSIQGAADGGHVAGIRIYNGGIQLYQNASLRFH
jgi:hypothetical protein